MAAHASNEQALYGYSGAFRSVGLLYYMYLPLDKRPQSDSTLGTLLHRGHPKPLTYLLVVSAWELFYGQLTREEEKKLGKLVNFDIHILYLNRTKFTYKVRPVMI